MSSHDPSRPAPPDRREVELLRHASDVVIELGSDGRILYANDAIERILSRPVDAFVGRSFLEVVVREDRADTLAAFQKVVSTGADASTRFRVLRADGLRVAFESTLRTFEIEGSRRVVAVARDVTQDTVEIAVARRRNEHYRKIVESGGRPAAIVDREGSFIFSNRAFKETFGHDIRLEDLFQRMPDEIRNTMEASWGESIRPESSGSGACDVAYRNDDGTYSWYAASWEPVRDDEGKRNFAVVCEDISDRKRVELALRSIAQGIASDGARSLEDDLHAIAQALEFDRLLLATVDPANPDPARIEAGWEDGAPLDQGVFDLGRLPDATVARGEACLFPSDVAALVPEVAERLSSEFESYAGQPLLRADGVVIGFVGGYGRKPIVDADLVRSLLMAFSAHASAAFDRQRAEAEIRANQDRFEVLARQRHELLSEIDERGVIQFASEACQPMLGYSPNELVGKNIESLEHPDDRPEHEGFLADLFAGARQGTVVCRIRHANGGWRWIESRPSSFTASDGARRALIVSRDITDQRYAELGRGLLYRVVQEGTDLVFVCEPDTKLLFANKAASRRLGAVSGDDDAVVVEGRPFYELLSPEDAERLETEILPALTVAKPWSGELHLRNPVDDEAIPTEATVFLFRGEEDEDQSFLAVTVRDIAARRTAEEALRQSEILLNEAQKMEAVGRLAGGIAHDFNNLLTAIIGYSDLVLDALGEGHGARRDAEEILRAAERAGGLTRQLLAFSRRQVLQPEPVDLNAIVADIDRMMRRLIGENIEVVTLQDGELRPIVADPGQIEQVLVNLVVNARDAMPNGGRLEIETANHVVQKDRLTDSGVVRAGAYALLRVSDTGIGMDEETRLQIFEPFFTTKEAHQGTGLGLATVYGIVSQSGGQIDVDSMPGAGTTFTIYFPVARAGSEQDDAPSETPRTGGRETILLVEDAAPVRRLVQRTLEKNGYQVLVAESATGALRHCSRHDGAIDLILSDVVLPRIPGPEIVQRARELRPGIRVLFMSGFTDDTLSRYGLDASRDSLIEKPFTPAAVLARVRAALDAD